MSIAIALSKVVSEKYGNFDTLENKQQVQILRNLVKHAVKKSLNQIHMPTSDKQIPYEIKKLQYKKRHKLKYEKSHQGINENMVDILYRLERIHPSTSKNDFGINLTSKDVDDTIQIQSNTSSNRIIEKSIIPTNFTQTKSKYNVFKTNADDELFDDILKLNNHLTRTKIQLDESLKEILNSNELQSRSILVKSLFHLYDFQNFIVFHQKLQDKTEKSDETYLTESLKKSHMLLKNYYIELLSIQGKKIASNEQLENILLLDRQFMSIVETHPLMKGFHLLLVQSIDFSKLEKIIQDTCFDIFSPVETESTEIQRIPQIKHDDDLDYDYEILAVIKKQGRVKLNHLQRKFINYPITVLEIVERLKNSKLISIEKINDEIIVSSILKPNL